MLIYIVTDRTEPTLSFHSDNLEKSFLLIRAKPTAV